MQIKISKYLSHNGNILKKKYELDDYIDNKKDTIFFGLFLQKDFEVLNNHKGKRIIFWAGSDSIHHDKVKSIANLDAIHLAQSTDIENDLMKCGIKKIVRVNKFNSALDMWKPCKLGTKVYWYKARRHNYGRYKFNEVKGLLPNIEFIVFNNPINPHEKMKDIYKECFCGVRPTEHDGCAQTAGEMGLMGRKIIWNGDTPNAVHYKDAKDIVKHIKELQKGYDYKEVAKETKQFYLKSEQWIKQIGKMI